jgi:hypothetical protein
MNTDFEKTACGWQALITGVSAVKTIERLQFLINQPLMPKKLQKPINIGLFDETARNQLNLFD